MGVVMRRVRGRLEDYKGRSDERLGIVSLLITKQGCPSVRWDCEVVDVLSGGESFLIGMDLMPYLGIRLVGVADDYPSGGASEGVSGNRIVGKVVSARPQLEDLKVHDVPPELEEFTTQEWKDEDRVSSEDLVVLEGLVQDAIAENRKIHATEFCSHPKAVVRWIQGGRPLCMCLNMV